MDYIEWNYIQAKKQAAKLEEQADMLKRLSDVQLDETLQELSWNWKGDSASAYLCKGEKIKCEIRSMVEELRKTAEVIRSSAERTFKAEMKAREMAKKRIY